MFSLLYLWITYFPREITIKQSCNHDPTTKQYKCNFVEFEMDYFKFSTNIISLELQSHWHIREEQRMHKSMELPVNHTQAKKNSRTKMKWESKYCCYDIVDHLSLLWSRSSHGSSNFWVRGVGLNDCNSNNMFYVFGTKTKEIYQWCILFLLFFLNACLCFQVSMVTYEW